MKTFLALAIVCVFAAQNSTADTLYVHPIAEPGGDGQSWQAPYRTFSSAINVAKAGDEIWAARGTYDVAEPLVVPNGVRFYGGFLGTEDMRQKRDWYRYPTILSGQGGSLVYLNDADSSTRFDGIEFHGGRESGVVITGGAPAFYNCTFANNEGLRGGAIRAESVGRLRFEYCVFKNNTSENDGAAIYISTCNAEVGPFGPFIGECLFINNEAGTFGAVLIDSCDGLPQFASSVFVGNKALVGGAISTLKTYSYITNCTFTKNTSELGAGRSLAVHGAHIQNSIFYTGDPTDETNHISITTQSEEDTATIVSRSNLVELDWDLGFWTSDPGFADPEDVYGPDGFFGTDDDGLRLGSSSVVRDGGVIDQFVNHQNTDAIGNARLVGRKIDCGAYETQRPGRLSPPEIMTKLRAGELVVFFRHAKTDWGQKDPGPSPECFPGRNLIFEGREQSYEIGRHMEALNVPIGDANSSPVCRCWETFAIMLNRYTIKDHWGGGGNPSLLPERLAELKTPPTTGNRVISTHDAVANAVFNPTGGGEILTTAELMEGDALMVEPLGDTMEVIAHWSSDTWERYHVRFPDEIVSVNEPVTANSESGLRVWPSPATSFITVATNSPTNAEIVNTTGMSVAQFRVDGEAHIPVSNLPAGLYIVRTEEGAVAKIMIW